MGKRNNKRRKEEIAEDYCFFCKDGGELRVCDFRNCLKTYHAKCVGQDDSFLKNDDYWCCGSHYCYICRRKPKFMCLCCPKAVCGNCYNDAEFATVKRNKGFCGHCSKLAFLIEENAEVDSDGLELEQKARTLHEDMIKHWISREIALLRNRIDLANEKGWRRELAQYMDRKQKLESPSEQSRLLGEIPKVIPEMVDTNLSPEKSSRKYKVEQIDLPELVIGETCNSGADFLGPKTPVKNNQDDTTFPATVVQVSVHTASQEKDTSQNLIQYTLKSRDDCKHALLKESNSDHQSLKCGLPQPSNTISASDDVNCRNLNTNMDVNQTVKESQSIMVADPVKPTVNDVIVLSDSDEEDVNIKVTSAERKGVVSSDVSIWHCSGIRGGGTKGPFSMSVLKRWSESATSSPLNYKVWKTGESEREAMLLRDALKLFFP